MSLIPIANLLQAPTGASVRATGVSILTSLGIPAAQWRPGGVASSLLTAMSSLFAAVIAQLVSGPLSSPFLSICPVAFLPYLALYVYGIIVNQATYATGLYSLTNPGGGTYSVGTGQLVLANSFTGITYANTAPFTLGPETTLSSIPITATTIGSVGNAVAGPGAGSVDTIVSTGIFRGAAVTGVNPAPLLGADGDSPQTIRNKCTAAIAARSYKGPNGAYQNAVVTAVNASGLPVNINRWSIETDPTTGFITVYLAAPSGVPTGADIAGVQANLNLIAQPQGITATAVSCTVVPI